MSLVESLALGLVLLFLAVAIIRLFKTPLKLALRTVGNTALGFGALWALNLTTAYTGLSLGLNLFNALTIALLGVPGLGLLLLLKWVLGGTY
ncbi:MAG: pro-sigmaK processing inhibitor BofA family protein [Oscillospiraceae bacterium]|nr:pro-sigmaK processing inhibitor BofA family protein [Oscillospiraceae bacterium]